MLCVVKRTRLAIAMVGCDMDMRWHVWWSGGRVAEHPYLLLLLPGGTCFNTVNVIPVVELCCVVANHFM